MMGLCPDCRKSHPLEIETRSDENGITFQVMNLCECAEPVEEAT